MEEKLDISRDAIVEFWRSRGEMAFSDVLAMDSSEAWVVDQAPRVEKLLVEALRNLDVDSLIEANDEDILTVLGYTRSSRAFRIMMWVADQRPDAIPRWAASALEIVEETRDSGQAQSRLARLAHVMADRVVAIERRSILNDAFSPRVLRRLTGILRLFAEPSTSGS